jgi:hypothetical protein
MDISDVDFLVIDEEVGMIRPYKCFIALYLIEQLILIVGIE